MSEYKSKVLNTIHYVEVPFSSGSCDTNGFELHSKNWLFLPVDLHVFDFKNVHSIDTEFYNSFQKFKNAADAKNSQVVSINIRAPLLQTLKKEGRDQVFSVVENINSIKTPKPQDTEHEIHSWIVKFTVAAARMAMDTLFHTTVAADENYRESRKKFDPSLFHRIAWVDVKAPLVRFDLRLYIDRNTLENLTKALLESSMALTDDIIDSTALELLNLIYSGAKSKLNTDRGYELPNVIPIMDSVTKISGSRKIDYNSIYLIPMATPVGTFFLEIDFSNNKHI